VTDALKSYSLESKTGFVTGAAGGIGSAITERLCGLGVRVILADVVDRVQSAAKEWASKGYKTFALKLDVTNSAAVEQAADLNKQFGHVDILVANAGVGYESPTETHSDADWHRCLKIKSGYRVLLRPLVRQADDRTQVRQHCVHLFNRRREGRETRIARRL
jgi:NAD(P)-dependent dehydrogenase (short-subunit alcohol dehydrogenase family)